MDKSYDELVKRLQTGHDSQCAMSYGMHEHCCDCSYVDRQDAADAIVALQARVAELERLLTHTGLLAAQDEHNALRHDIARHVQIATEQAQEMEELRQDLAAARANTEVSVNAARLCATAKLEALRADLAAARALLRKMSDAELGQRLWQWHDAIDAALAGDKK